MEPVPPVSISCQDLHWLDPLKVREQGLRDHPSTDTELAGEARSRELEAERVTLSEIRAPSLCCFLQLSLRKVSALPSTHMIKLLGAQVLILAIY